MAEGFNRRCDEGSALYARLPGKDPKKNRDAQIDHFSAFTISKGWSVSKQVMEFDPRLRGHSPEIMKLLADHGGVAVIVVEHRDRPMRFDRSTPNLPFDPRDGSLFV